MFNFLKNMKEKFLKKDDTQTFSIEYSTAGDQVFFAVKDDKLYISKEDYEICQEVDALKEFIKNLDLKNDEIIILD